MSYLFDVYNISFLSQWFVRPVARVTQAPVTDRCEQGKETKYDALFDAELTGLRPYVQMNNVRKVTYKTNHKCCIDIFHCKAQAQQPIINYL